MIKYLLIINAIGLALYLFNMLLYSFTADGQVDALITIVCLLGGAFGVFIPFLIFHEKINKEHEDIILSSVFICCIVPIEIIILICLKTGAFNAPINNIISIYEEHKFFFYYLIIINVITFIVYGADKLFAIEHRSRISIATMLGLAFLGGEIGGLLAMYLFWHKMSKDYFIVGLPLILIMHLFLIFFIASR